jgi:hypothetical protein
MMRIFEFVLLLATFPSEASSQLDRLFFSGAERQALDVARERAGRLDGNDYSAPIVDGMVRRSDGKNTIWVNGQPYRASDAAANRAATLPSNGNESLRIKVSGSEPAPQRVRAAPKRSDR